MHRNPTPYTLNPLLPKPQTLNPKSYTLNPLLESTTLTLKLSVSASQLFHGFSSSRALAQDGSSEQAGDHDARDVHDDLKECVATCEPQAVGIQAYGLKMPGYPG